MILGRKIVYSCSACGRKVKVGSIESGNNCGAILYSDGMQDAPMLPQYPEETKCKQCGKIFDFNEKTLVKILNSAFSLEPDCDRATFLEVDDYKKKIELNQGDEKQNRLKMWHTANGTYGSYYRSENNDLYKENCNRLIHILKGSQDLNDKITMAELHRNIGDFDTCVDIISSLNSELKWLQNAFLKQCDAKNTETFVLRN